jgi:hypothetical protein
MLGKKTSTTATKLNAINVQSSTLGRALSLGWGRGRMSCNLGWYGGFRAIPQTTKTGGKGLGGSKNTTYTYKASVIMMLGEGPIAGVRTVYKDKSVFTNGATSALAQAGLSLATGEVDQAPWGYLVSQFPSEALAYSGIAYVYAANYDLSDSATLSNHSFEVDFAIQLGGGVCDADPRDIAVDYLTSPSHGLPGWSAGLIGDLDNWSYYARATGLLLSPVEESQRRASEFLLEIAQASNTDLFWSEGLLKATPLGDAPATGNGVTWTPDLTHCYHLSEDDFLADDGEPPVVLEIVDQTDAYNIVQVEFRDRANQYNAAIATAQDLANIVEFGRRKQDPTNWQSIADAAVAQKATQLLLQRTLYTRERFKFRLPWDFVLLEPTDIVTITTVSDGLLLDHLPVRIAEIEEDEDGQLVVLANALPMGAASALSSSGQSGAGYQPNADIAPGSVSDPVLFNAPSSLTSGRREIWCAASSTSPNWGGCEVWISVDGITFSRVGVIEAPARYGELTAALALTADPDNTNTLSIDLAESLGTIAGGTAAEMNAGATLSLVGSELISYQDATLTGPHQYDLSPLRRGLYGTVPASHSSGARFVRLDDAIFKIDYGALSVGATVQVKLPSFNIFGRALESLADVPEFTVELEPATARPDKAGNVRLAQPWTGTTLNVVCDAAERATAYKFRFFLPDEATLVREINSSSPTAIYTASLAAQDGVQRAYAIECVATNSAGDAAPSEWLHVTNVAPAAVTTPAIAGGATTAVGTCDVSGDADVAGYVVFYSDTTGFDPSTSGGVVSSGIPSVQIFGLPAGTYYGRIAAYDGWTSNPAHLNLSSEITFTITTGGGSTPSGGGSSGGGYGGQYQRTLE